MLPLSSTYYAMAAYNREIVVVWAVTIIKVCLVFTVYNNMLPQQQLLYGVISMGELSSHILYWRNTS